MADLVCLHTKSEVEQFCRRSPFLHLYALGDLDDFFWPHTIWYALREGAVVQQLVLLYTDCTLPTILALAEPPVEGLRDLLRRLLPFLPRRFHAHLSEGVADVLAEDYHLHSHGLHHKMGLLELSRLAELAGTETVLLSVADREALESLYQASYPGNWFVPRMLETGCYFGIRRGSDLVSVAGVHVYSRAYRAAALGNITTHPDVRGQGCATAVTARVCQELLRLGIATIGLNVKADNRGAITCYEKLGFTRVADYGEYMVESR